MSKIYKGAIELVGNTPLVEVTNIEKKERLKARLLVKLEYFNPAGSVKDRVGKAMIEDAERIGRLKPGSVIIEPTSGNTGIGLAAVSAVKGYRMILTMPDTMSVERRNILKAYGAEIVLTPGEKGMSGAIQKAEELAREIPDSFIPGQFDNPVNPRAHMESTGPEIWHDTDGQVDICGVCGNRRNPYRYRNIFEGKESPHQGYSRGAIHITGSFRRKRRPPQDSGNRSRVHSQGVGHPYI